MELINFCGRVFLGLGLKFNPYSKKGDFAGQTGDVSTVLVISYFL